MRQVTVVVDDQHKDSLDAVVEQLRAGGMAVDQVLSGLGIVTGSVPDDALGTLQGVEGVASVDEQLRYQVPPPDSDIQ